MNEQLLQEENKQIILNKKKKGFTKGSLRVFFNTTINSNHSVGIHPANQVFEMSDLFYYILLRINHFCTEKLNQVVMLMLIT